MPAQVAGFPGFLGGVTLDPLTAFANNQLARLKKRLTSLLRTATS